MDLKPSTNPALAIKSGVQLSAIRPASSPSQFDLFDLSCESMPPDNAILMQTLDTINRRFPKAVSIASSGFDKSWKPKPNAFHNAIPPIAKISACSLVRALSVWRQVDDLLLKPAALTQNIFRRGLLIHWTRLWRQTKWMKCLLCAVYP